MFVRRGTPQILIYLAERGAARSTDLDEAHDLIARQVIGTRLAELRSLGVVTRTVIEGPPLGSRYELTEVGQELAAAAKAIDALTDDSRITALG